jgi:PiT family inorganic phosphate transporter
VSGGPLLVSVVVAALVFDFTNGFHDTANAVATSVSTRALGPRAAVTIASLMNFAGAFTSTAVATTIGTGIVAIGGHLRLEVLLMAVVGATAWNLVTWYLALPSSSSYALIGGLLGAQLVAEGSDGVRWDEVARKVLVPATAAPLLGFAAAYVVLVGLLWALRNVHASVANRQLRIAQIGVGSLMAFAHGANDAQKTMGVIALAVATSSGQAGFTVPTWVIVASATALAAGTYSGGWRIMRTLGYRVFRIEPAHGFAAQAAATGLLLVTAGAGLPVSTTGVIAGSVFGAGAGARVRHISWRLALEIALGWVLTLPAAAAIAAVIYLPLRVFG